MVRASIRLIASLLDTNEIEKSLRQYNLQNKNLGVSLSKHCTKTTKRTKFRQELHDKMVTRTVLVANNHLVHISNLRQKLGACVIGNTSPISYNNIYSGS